MEAVMLRRGLGVLALVVTAGSVQAQEPARTDGWVVLSIGEYRELRARAFPVAPDPPPPPVDSVISRIDYDLRVGSSVVTGEARLAVDVLKRGWVSLQVPQGFIVRRARVDGRPTTVASGPPPRILLSQTGRTTIALDIVVPVTSSGGVESMNLPPAPAAMSSVRLTVPRASVELTPSGGLVIDQAETATESRWIVHGAQGRPLSFSWRRRLEDRRAGLPLRSRASVHQMVALGEEASMITANVSAEILQGAAQQIVVSVPESVTVNNVSGPAVADWVHQGSSLTISFLEPVTASTGVTIAAESRLPRDGTIAVPILRVPAAERETGGVAVDVVGPGEITERGVTGVRRTDASMLANLVAGRETASMVAFEFLPLGNDRARALTLDVVRFTARAMLIANVEEAHYDAVIGEDGKALIRGRYAVRNNQRSFLALTLPQGAVVWSAALENQPVRPGTHASGALLLPLRKSRTGEGAAAFAVEVTYVQRLDALNEKGNVRIPLPAVDLPVSRTGLTLHYSPRYRMEVQPGQFREEADPGPTSAALRNDSFYLAVGAAESASPPPPAAPPPPPPAAPSSDRAGAGGGGAIPFGGVSQARDGARVAAGVLPVRVPMPQFGKPLFAAAELTPENMVPAIDIVYRRTTGR
jgi:hypothetical protein